jgi:citrate synthase
MAILSSMVCSLSAYYPDANEVGNSSVNDINIARLLSKVRTIAAYSYKKSIGEPFMHPKTVYSYVSNFLQMMFAQPTEPYEVDEEVTRMLDVLLMLHADHEQNCSTSTVRMVGSSHANVYASISAGICALWGPLHGGANQEVLEMLEAIERDGGDHKKFIALAKNKDSGFRLMGFGHRVYKNYDPRAKIIKEQCEKLLARLGGNDKLLDIARRLEEDTLKDPYFADRKLFPNVDFYSGIIYRALGIPTNMFTVMFALGRMPGWLAHWREMLADPMTRIGRPRQVYIGPTLNHYVPIAERA